VAGIRSAISTYHSEYRPLQKTVLIAFILGSLISGCNTQSIPGTSGEAEYRNWGEDAVYVGREVCQSCHPDNYATFVESQMGRSWKKASLTLSAADFDRPLPVYSDTDDLYYQPFHRGEDLFVREYRLAGTDTVHNRVEQIDYIVGSGQHTNSHIYEINGYLYQIPVTWYVQAGKWGLAPGFSHGNSRFSRPITQQCMTCHNGYSEFEDGSENRFSTVAGGIGCENCHGPGSIHVEEKRAGIVVDVSREIDYSIVNPGKLEPRRQLDVCQRCHMQAADVFEPGRSVDSFRPGQVLSNTLNVYWPRQPDSVEVFNMASHPDRLGMSACFRASWEDGSALKPMTCVTCHNPHLAIEATPDLAYTNACQTCHEASEIPDCTDPSVVAGNNTLACSSCHMPESGTQDIPNVRITDHYIRVVREAPELTGEEIESRRRFIRLAALIDPAPGHSRLAEGFLSYYELITNRPGMLDSADVRLRRARLTEPDKDLSELHIRLWYLREDYASIRRYSRANKPDEDWSAWTHFRIGEAFAAAEENDYAIPYLEQAVVRSPGQLRFMDRLASVYTRRGEIEKALRVYERIEAANPNLENAVTNRGYTHLVAGDFDAAERDFLYAIALYPDAEVALGNLASLYANTGREVEARPILEQLLRLDSDNEAYIQLYRLVVSRL
jgi:hypothetical protein